jgi:hypothetical protein
LRTFFIYTLFAWHLDLVVIDLDVLPLCAVVKLVIPDRKITSSNDAVGCLVIRQLYTKEGYPLLVMLVSLRLNDLLGFRQEMSKVDL